LWNEVAVTAPSCTAALLLASPAVSLKGDVAAPALSVSPWRRVNVPSTVLPKPMSPPAALPPLVVSMVHHRRGGAVDAA